jgi:GxxExxY protein
MRCSWPCRGEDAPQGHGEHRDGVVEIKACEVIQPIHEAQRLTYMKLGGWKLGLVINFNVPVLKEGSGRRIL